MSKPDDQQPLFDKGEWWEDQWRGMPEFVQENQKPFKTILVHFDNQDAVDRFSAAIGQTVKPHTKYIWFPEIKIGSYAGKAYVDESKLPDLCDIQRQVDSTVDDQNS